MILFRLQWLQYTEKQFYDLLQKYSVLYECEGFTNIQYMCKIILYSKMYNSVSLELKSPSWPHNVYHYYILNTEEDNPHTA